MPTALEQLTEEIEAKSRALSAIFEAHPDYDLTEEQVLDIRAKNDELTALGKKLDSLRSLDHMRTANAQTLAALDAPANALPTPRKGRNADQSQGHDARDLGLVFINSPQFKNWSAGARVQVQLPDWDLKATFDRTTGFPPESIRTARVEETPLRRPVVADLIPQTRTTAAAIKYMEETTFTNNAAAVAEGASKPESALGFTERSVPVEKIATWIPITDEQLEDAPQVQSLINNRLTLMLRLTEEAALLTGSGTTPQLTGFLNKTGVQTQAKGADPTPDAVFKAVTKVRSTGFANPSGVILHPNDWQDIRLLRTTDGVYIWGSPAEAGPERIWGLPVISTTAQTENTGLVGDFAMYSEIFRRTGIMIDVSRDVNDNFIKNIQVIRIEERLALVIYRPTAFCKVTGI